jgi:hypothetical protein
MVPKSDITLLFLAQNSVHYTQPVYDPWFLADGTNWESKNFIMSRNGTTAAQNYSLANSYVRALGCVEQFRFCNPNSGACTPYSGSVELGLELDALKLNYAQVAAAKILMSAASTVDETISGLADDGQSSHIWMVVH